MTKIYHKTFGVSELDRERDEALSLRMAALSFIQPKHLDIPELYSDEKAWQLAIKELHKINNYKARSGSLAQFLASLILPKHGKLQGNSIACASWSVTTQESICDKTCFRDAAQAWQLSSAQALLRVWVQAPRDKLVCILNCCRVINNLLHAAVAAGEARGAPPFLSTS